MGLTGFTNQPGQHYHYADRQGRQVGVYFGNRDVNELLYDELYVDEIAAKWYPTPGYAGCTDWARKVAKVVKDEPAKARKIAYNSDTETYPGGIMIDLMIDDHISRSFPLDSFDNPDPGYDNAHNESITKALNNLTQSYAGIGADLAQARKTCDEFSHLVLRIGGFINAMKHGNFGLAAENLLGGKVRDLKSAQKTLSGNWLEFIYGWKPLAKDLHEAQELAHKALLKPVPVMARGTGRSQHVSQVPDYYGFHLDLTNESSHRTYLEGNVVNPTLYLLSQAGLINPLSIAWEVVPFSFVLDWFIPVGATLQAITAGVGLDCNGGFTSTQINRSNSIGRNLPTLPPAGQDYYHWVTAGSYREIAYEFRRQCHTSFPSPKLYADVTPYSTTRAVNALALVRQLMK